MNAKSQKKHDEFFFCGKFNILLYMLTIKEAELSFLYVRFHYKNIFPH